MARKAIGLLALWLAAAFALAAPAQAAPRTYHAHHHRHPHQHPGHRYGGPAPRLHPLFHGPNRPFVHYLPPNLGLDSGKQFARGQKVPVLVGPFVPSAAPDHRKDSLTVQVSYIYQLFGHTAWIHGPLHTLTFDMRHMGVQSAGVIQTGPDWETLVVLTAGTENYGGAVSPVYTSGQSVSLYTPGNYPQRMKVHYLPPNARYRGERRPPPVTAIPPPPVMAIPPPPPPFQGRGHFLPPN